MTAPRMTGLVAAPFTPLHPDGAVAEGTIERLAAALAADGVAGAFICGTTGEGLSLTTAERRLVAERWVAAAPPNLRVIVHVGHACAADCRDLAAHAARIGAAAIGCLAPTFFKPPTVRDLVEFCRPVAAAATPLPFYYYHIPSLTGARFAMIDFLRQAADRIPTLAGVKYSHDDLHDVGGCLRFEDGRFEVLYGRDEMLLAGLACGVTAAVGSTYNYIAPVYHELIAAFDRGDMAAARRLQGRAGDICNVMLGHGGLPAGKAIMSLRGLDCGPVRPPLVTLDAERRQALARALEPLGFPSPRAAG
jgi:N-acetylneuraminate lyase